MSVVGCCMGNNNDDLAWTHNFAPITGAIVSATLEIDLTDADGGRLSIFAGTDDTGTFIGDAVGVDDWGPNNVTWLQPRDCGLGNGGSCNNLLDIPSTLFGDLMDGSFSLFGDYNALGFYGVNRAILTITFDPPTHFLCYEAEGDAVDVTVDLVDQFGELEQVRVDEPEVFCNPVDKNGEGVSDGAPHLTCYKIEVDDDEFEAVVTVDKQFGEQILDVGVTKFLCVPSQKLEVQLDGD